MKTLGKSLVAFLLTLTMALGALGGALAEGKTTVTVYTARDTNVFEYVEPLFEEA